MVSVTTQTELPTWPLQMQLGPAPWNKVYPIMTSTATHLCRRTLLSAPWDSAGAIRADPEYVECHTHGFATLIEFFLGAYTVFAKALSVLAWVR
jgi:hypothetical protein